MKILSVKPEKTNRQRSYEQRLCAKEIADRQRAAKQEFKSEVREALRVAYVAYSKAPVAKAYLKEEGYDADTFLPLDSWVGTQGICCVRNRRAYVAFRGTTLAVTDLLMDALALPWYQPRVHLGFGWSWHSIADQVVGWLKLNRSKFDGITLSGHSLGGAIAHVAALKLTATYPIAKVITFGAPRSSFYSTQAKYDSAPTSFEKNSRLKDVTHRLVNKHDFVSKVPPWFIGYRHVGELLYLSQAGEVHRGAEAKKEKWNDRLFDPVWRILKTFYSDPYTTWGVPVVKSRSFKALNWYKQYRHVFPVYIPEMFAYGLLICVLPILLLLAFCLYCGKSTTSHFKDDYCSYYFDRFMNIDSSLDEIKTRLNVKKPPWIISKAKNILSVVFSIGLAAVILFLIYKIVVLWVIPVFRYSFLS